MVQYILKEGFTVDGEFHTTNISTISLVTSELIPTEISKIVDGYPCVFTGDDEAGVFTFDDDYSISYTLASFVGRAKEIAKA